MYIEVDELMQILLLFASNNRSIEMVLYHIEEADRLKYGSNINLKISIPYCTAPFANFGTGSIMA